MNTIQFLYGIMIKILGMYILHYADTMVEQLYGAGMDIAGILIIGISFVESK